MCAGRWHRWKESTWFAFETLIGHVDTQCMNVAGIPCELLQHWDPAQPLLVGGLSAAEEGRGFLQLRLKRHRWFGKLLKNRDPLTFSVGWRRFQSMPVYATEDANGRHRCVVYDSVQPYFLLAPASCIIPKTTCHGPSTPLRTLMAGTCARCVRSHHLTC